MEEILLFMIPQAAEGSTKELKQKLSSDSSRQALASSGSFPLLFFLHSQMEQNEPVANKGAKPSSGCAGQIWYHETENKSEGTKMPLQA